MGLLRRTPPPPAAAPGDWLDALQVAMRVDPALRPKRDPRPPAEADEPRRPAAEVPRRFRTPEAAGGPAAMPPVERLVERAVERPAIERPVRPAERPAAGPVEKPWLPPIRPPVAPPPAAPPGLPRSALPDAPPAAVEDLLQWVCRLSRLRRAGPAADAFAAAAVRTRAEAYLADIAAANPTGLRLRGPLSSFVDVVMMRAGLPLLGPWRPLGPVPPERAYGLAVAEAAADPTGRHDGTWAVHHAGLALVADLIPAVADFPGGPAVLDQLDVKLHGVAPAADDRICPAAYEGVFDHAIVRPVGRPIRAVAAAAVGLLLLAVAAAVLLNLRYVAQLRGSVDAVTRTLHAQPPNRP